MTDPQTGYNFGEMHQQHGQESELLPEGVYDVVVETAKHQSSKDGSKPQLVVQFRIVDHPKASGRKVTNTFTFSASKPEAISIFFRHMAGLGFNGEFFQQNPTNPFPVMAAQAVGRRARISVKHDTWQGVTRPKVGNVMPSAGPAGAGGGLPPAPGGGALPPLPVAPPTPVAAAPVAPPVPAPAPVAPSAPVAPAPAPVAASAPAPEAPAPAPAVQEQAPAPAPAAPVAEQAAPVPAGAVPPAPAVPF